MEQRGLEAILGGLLTKDGSDFLTLASVRDKLPKAEADRLGLAKKKSSNGEVEAAIRPHLGESLTILKKGNNKYLAKVLAPEEMLFRAIRRTPGKTIGSIGFPATIPVKIEAANKLLAEGRVYGQINSKGDKVSLYPVIERTPGASTEFSATTERDASASAPRETEAAAPAPASDAEAFRAAFDELDRGRIFVPIFEIRRRLGWPRDTFDRVLETLRDRAVVQLHAGDTRSMTSDDVRDSYEDDNGYLHITMTWKKQ